MAIIKPRVKSPKKAEKGEVIEIKALISHPMESGNRKDKKGQPIPKNMIKHFKCEYNGVVVFEIDFLSSTSANPFLTFKTVATESGELVFTWTEDSGNVYSKTSKITVE